MLATAAGCVVSAFAFAALRQADREPGPMARSGIVQSLRDGASALRGRPVLIRIAVTAAALNFGGSALGALYLVFAYRELDLSAPLVAAAYVVNSVASVLAAATAAAVIRRLGLGRVVPVFAPVAAAALFLIPAAAVLPPFATLALYEAIFGYCATVWFIATATLQQTLVPAHLLGRVVALSRTLGALALPAGALLGGALAQWWGVLPTLLTFALAGLLGTTIGLTRTRLDAAAPDRPADGG
jgi:predicted MFS family arabinose efflux permease